MDSDMNDLRGKIIGILSRGPALLIDVSEGIERDSLQTEAILDYFVGNGELRKTVRRYGTSPVYFLEKDKDAAVAKLLQVLNGQEKELVGKIRAAGTVKVDDLTPAERYISQNLQDFVKRITAQDDQTGERVEYIYYYALSLDQLKELINTQIYGKRPSARKEKTVVPKKSGIKKQLEVGENVVRTLMSNHFENPLRVDRDLFVCEYGEHRIKVVVQLIDKKKLTSRDFVKIAGYATLHKTVAFILTNAESVSGDKKLGNMVTIVRTGF